MAPSDRAVLQRADELFLARTVESDTAADDLRLSFAGLYAALSGLDPAPAGFRRLLLANRRLRADFDAVSRELAAAGRAVRLPAVAAAASATTLDERHFPGGSIRIASVAARPGQVFVVIVSADGVSEPACIIAEAPDGTFAVALTITATGIDGQTQLVLDTALDHHGLVVRLLQDPGASVTIVWRNEPA